MQRADSLLKPVIRDLGIEDSLRLAEIRRNWTVLFSEPVSSRMFPSFLSRGELVLTVDSPVWLQQLNLCKGDILLKLRASGIGNVRFKLGRVSACATRKAKSPKCKTRVLTDNEQTFITETAALIKDEDLKQSLKTALGKAITSGKTKIR